MSYYSKILLSTLAAPLLLPLPLSAEENKMSLGLYANIVGSSGEPSNDVLGAGLIGSYKYNASWYIDMELIHSKADFERPWKIAGVIQDPSVDTIDAKYTSNILMAHLRQNIKSNNPAYDWYWSAGIGLNSLDIDDASGPVEGGGTFNIKSNASTETIVGFKTGIKHHVSETWNINYAIRLDYHMADWEVTDSVSNASGTIDDYITYGALIGVEKLF